MGVRFPARRLGFERIVSSSGGKVSKRRLKVTLVPAKTGARERYGTHIADGGWILIEHRGGGSITRETPRTLRVSGDWRPDASGNRPAPDRCPYPDSFRHVHMGPDEAVRAFKDLRAEWLVPMHYGTFKLSFEAMEEPERWLRQIAGEERLLRHLRDAGGGIPEKF